MVEVQLYNLLGPLVANKAFPNLAVQGTTAPFIVYTDITSQPDTSICGTTRDSERLFQVDAYVGNHSDLTTLREAIFAALTGAAFVESIESFSTDYEPDTRLYRVLFSVRCWESAASV